METMSEHADASLDCYAYADAMLKAREATL
jgi:hypothetical protein